MKYFVMAEIEKENASTPTIWKSRSLQTRTVIVPCSKQLEKNPSAFALAGMEK